MFYSIKMIFRLKNLTTLKFILPFLLLLLNCCSNKNFVTKNEFTNLESRVAVIEDTIIPAKALKTSAETLQHQNPAKATNAEKNLYNQAMSLLKSKQYSKSALIFQRMLQDNPSGHLAPNARYWLGECFYAQGDFQNAALEFQKTFNDYPASAKASDAILKLAYCQSKMSNPSLAMETVQSLLERYPESSAALFVKSGRLRFPGI